MFEGLVPLVLPPHAGIVDHSADLSIPEFFFLDVKKRNEQKRYFFLYKA